MIAKLRSKLGHDRRTHLRVTVDEADLNTLLFLQAVGFSSVSSADGQIELRHYVGDDPRPFGQTSDSASKSRES